MAFVQRSLNNDSEINVGKIFGGLIGWYFGGFWIGLLGIFVGHILEQILLGFLQQDPPEALRRIQTSFFETTFTLIGYLAKSDGIVSQEEIDQTQQLMDKMGLTADHKREAIRLFKIGAAPDFDPEPTLKAFQETCGHRDQLIHMLVVYLVNTALADGRLDPKEEIALRRVTESLHFSHLAFEQLLRMIRAQSAFSGGGYQYQQEYQQGRTEHARPSRLKEAYAALGVDENTSDAEIKKAYRKLMSENHPDKLMGQGVPEDMIKMATERSQKIQAAYDLIKKTRKH